MRLTTVAAPLAAVVLTGIALGGCEDTPDEFTKISAKVYCGSLIKKQLRDPDSYRFEAAKIVSTSGEYKQYGEALISFRSKNGFGGYVKGVATCTAYEQDGKLWHRVKLL